MDIKSKLDEIGLSPENSVVIGSGILDALEIRGNKDVDAVVSRDAYERLSLNNHFQKAENHGKEVLTDGLMEIGTSWTVIGEDWDFNMLLNQSVVIDEVRYNTLQFLLDVKRSWLKDADVREKDINDVRLIEEYMRRSA